MPDEREGWEKLGRRLTLPVPYLLEVEVRREPEGGRWFARTGDLGTVIEATATTRPGALAALERLVERTLAKLIAERALAG